MGNYKHDWEALYKEYLASPLNLYPFLESKGINPSTDHTKQNTHWWRKSVAETNKYLSTLSRTMFADGHVEAVENVWELLQQWRTHSAMTQYRWALAAGTHVELLLNKSIEKDENGKPKESNLSPRDLSALTSAMEKIQNIQRTALGLSSTQTGAEPPPPPEKHVDNPTPAVEQQGPVFVVEVNSNGKFSRPRPRIVSQITNGSPGFTTPKKEE